MDILLHGWSRKFNSRVFSKRILASYELSGCSEPNTWCDYVSEILDARFVGPLFMALVEGNPSEREKANEINKTFYQENKKRGTCTNPFHVQKDGSIDGLEMFGLTESTIFQMRSVFLFTSRIKSLVASEVQHQNPVVRRIAPDALAVHLCLDFQELFKKVNPEELQALETV